MLARMVVAGDPHFGKRQSWGGFREGEPQAHTDKSSMAVATNSGVLCVRVCIRRALLLWRPFPLFFENSHFVAIMTDISFGYRQKKD